MCLVPLSHLKTSDLHIRGLRKSSLNNIMLHFLGKVARN